MMASLSESFSLEFALLLTPMDLSSTLSALMVLAMSFIAFSVFFSKHLAISRIVCVFLQCGMRIIMFWNYFAKLLKFSNICKT